MPSSEKVKKKCFVITPIGEEGSTIRRHIDGIINAAIRPALQDKYEVVAAHHINTTGSINNQVIVEIYNSDLVVANLTELNPNVMYELALRHALKKPVIMIMEKGSKSLPFDVINERTIFYVNDSQGVLDLKKDIEKVEKTINVNKVSNPIYDALNGFVSEQSLIETIKSKNTEDANILEMILDKINRLENYTGKNDEESAYSIETVRLELEILDEVSETRHNELIKDLMKTLVRDKMTSKFISDPSYNLIGSGIEFYVKLKNNRWNNVEEIFRKRVREYLDTVKERIYFKFLILPF